MKILTALIPYVLSGMIGYLLINTLFEKAERPPLAVRLLMAAGLGVGISAVLVFISFWIFDGWHRWIVILAHAALGSILWAFWFALKNQKLSKSLPREATGKKAIVYGVFVIALLPLWVQSQYYPLGGWDAWQVWNFKARFLFLAGNQWENIFLPVLWRSSPHYPLLLPCINVWGWSIMNHPTPLVPQLTSLLFTVLTCGLLLAILLKSTNSPWIIIGPGLLLTLPFYSLQAVSQYSDIVLSFYFLAGLFCISETLHPVQASKAKRLPPGTSAYAVLAGFFLSLAAFTKPEGLVAAGLIALLTSILWLTTSYSNSLKIKLLLLFATAMAIGAIPSFIFHTLYSPGNLTFINGLTSQNKPVSLYRLKMILAFLLIELKSAKWNGLWLLLGIGIIFCGKRCWRREIVILPLFMFSYLVIVLIYCWINTYFPIGWWLQVSLNRILFSLLPIAVFWIFSSLWIKK